MNRNHQHLENRKLKHLQIIEEDIESIEQTLYSPKNTNTVTQLEQLDSQSCDIFWDQSSKANILLTKIKIINGKKSTKSVSISIITHEAENSAVSTSSFFDIFGNSMFK
ncbi:Hypothetical_protein [Hexamita inflata]|uniref:Hypothetical_protein n=1 Tax=Hexamita inflata TaxID=28002 RepID=A0AA86PQG0_9EUKA|nr:Hypothetical protein HINF_LOCUS32105 [Hexamita inflata]